MTAGCGDLLRRIFWVLTFNWEKTRQKRAPRGLPGGLCRHAVSRRQDRRFYDGNPKLGFNT